MITSVFLYGFQGFLRFILTGILNAPPVVLDSGIGGAFAGIGNATAMLDMIIPVGVLIGTFVAIPVVMEGYIFSYKLIRWIYQKIPGIN